MEKAFQPGRQQGQRHGGELDPRGLFDRETGLLSIKLSWWQKSEAGSIKLEQYENREPS